MKQIFKYDESTSTHLTMIEVQDDHVLLPDELDALPDNFYTPAKLVAGKIVGSTLEESNQFYNVKPTEVKPNSEQALTKQVMSLSIENEQLQNDLNAVQTQLMQLSKTILGGKQ